MKAQAAIGVSSDLRELISLLNMGGGELPELKSNSQDPMVRCRCCIFEPTAIATLANLAGVPHLIGAPEVCSACCCHVPHCASDPTTPLACCRPAAFAVASPTCCGAVLTRVQENCLTALSSCSKDL